jgi:hypothetical protein
LAEEEEEKTPIDERIKELEKEGLSNREIVLTLYDEGYNTGEIMKRGYSLAYLRSRRRAEVDTERSAMAAIEGGTRGEGFMQELKNMIRAEISRTRELTELFYDVGLGVLLAALRKSGIEIEDFRKMVAERGDVRDYLKKASDTAFKALDYYQSDLIAKVEAERDEARAYASLLEAQIDDIKHNLDPKVRLEKMIYNLVLLSGTVKVDPNTLMTLIDKWLGLEVVA